MQTGWIEEMRELQEVGMLLRNRRREVLEPTRDFDDPKGRRRLNQWIDN